MAADSRFLGWRPHPLKTGTGAAADDGWTRNPECGRLETIDPFLTERPSLFPSVTHPNGRGGTFFCDRIATDHRRAKVSKQTETGPQLDRATRHVETVKTYGNFASSIQTTPVSS